MTRMSNRARVHPTSCTCRMCKRKKKREKQEIRRLGFTFYGLVFFALILGTVL